MTTDKISAATVLIITLLIANLGLSAYIAFRPSPAMAPSKDAATSEITKDEAQKLSETLVPLYNQQNLSALYDQFDPLAKVQFTREQLAAQIEKLGSVIGKIEQCAYSHATVAGVQEGRKFYTLHYKVSLSGNSFPTGSMTLNVYRNDDKLGLYGFFVNGGTAPGNR